jgi:methyl-accepting chemotaxis protein
MNWKNNITGIAVAFLIISQLAVLALASYAIKKRGNAEISNYRAEELERVKQALKSHVDNVYALIEDQYNRATDKPLLERYYGHRLRNVIDIAETVLKGKAAKVRSGELSLAKAQEQAREEIKKFRYDNGTGYVWINDAKRPFPRMIMHPTIPALDGTILDDAKYNCALGRGQNLFQAFVDAGLKDGDGFVDYIWPKPGKDGLIPDVPKLSYVRLFREWNWIVGTGIYVDDAIQNIRYDNGTGYFWINDTTKPVPRMIMHPVSPELEGKVLDDPKFNTALGIKKNLVVAFMEVCEKDGAGFVDYVWSKPTAEGLKENMPKLSYVKLFKPLGWIVGTGVYIDSIDEAVAKKAREINRQVAGLIFLTLLLSASIITCAVKGMKYMLVRMEQRNVFLVPDREEHPGPQEEVADVVAAGVPAPQKELLSAAKDLCAYVFAEQAKLIALQETLGAIKKAPDHGAAGAHEVAALTERVRDIARILDAALTDIRKSAGCNTQAIEALQRQLDDLRAMIGK